MTTAIIILSGLLLLALVSIFLLDKKLLRTDHALRTVSDCYSEERRRLRVLDSGNTRQHPRFFYVYPLVDNIVDVKMQVSIPDNEEAFSDGERYTQILIKRYATDDRAYNLLLAEELAEKLNETYSN